MAGQIVLALFGSVMAGVVLVLLGLRGKRLNSHPICGLCQFDLEGTYPQSITCPECGAGLRRRKGVRIGARRKRWIVVSIGALLIAAPAGLLGVALYAVLTGADLNVYKPVGLLIWEGRRASDATADAAVKELLSRVQNKQVSSETVRNIVDAALEVQGDAAATWREGWGDIVETAKITGAIGIPEYQRFLEQAAVLEFFIRPRVRQGDPIAVEARLKESRIGSGSSFTVTTRFTERTVDGRSASPNVASANWLGGLLGVDGRANPAEQPGYFHISGSSGVWGGANYGQCRCLLMPGGELEPGPHKAEVAMKLDVQLPPTGAAGGTWLPLPGMRASNRGVRTATLSFVVAPPEEPTVRLVTPTPAQVEAFRAALSVQGVQVQQSNAGFMGGGFKWGHVNLNASDVPLDGAFTVKLRTGESMSPSMGHVQFRKVDPGEAVATGPARMMANQQWVSLQLPAAFDAKTVTIVLEPDLKAAIGTVDMTEIYGEAIEFEDVEVSQAPW